MLNNYGYLIRKDKGKEFIKFYNSIAMPKDFIKKSKELTDKLDIDKLNALMDKDKHAIKPW